MAIGGDRVSSYQDFFHSVRIKSETVTKQSISTTDQKVVTSNNKIVNCKHSSDFLLF